MQTLSNDEHANLPEAPTSSSDSRAATSNPQDQSENPAHPTDHGPTTGSHDDTAVTRKILQVLTKDKLKDLMKTRQLTNMKKNCTKDGKHFVTLSNSQN